MPGRRGLRGRPDLGGIRNEAPHVSQVRPGGVGLAGLLRHADAGGLDAASVLVKWPSALSVASPDDFTDLVAAAFRILANARPPSAGCAVIAEPVSHL